MNSDFSFFTVLYGKFEKQLIKNNELVVDIKGIKIINNPYVKTIVINVALITLREVIIKLRFVINCFLVLQISINYHQIYLRKYVVSK